MAYKQKFVQTNGDYVNLATEMDMTLTEGVNYQIQIIGRARIIENSTKPTTDGLYIFGNKPFDFECKGENVWLKTLGVEPCEVIIVEET